MENEKKKFSMIKLFSTISLYVMIGLIVVTMLSIFGYIKMNANLFLILSILFILCLGCWMAIPWAKILQNKKAKIVSIVFLAILGLCCLLWIVSMWLGVDLYKQMRALANDGNSSLTFENLLNRLEFLRWTCIISIQFLVASAIANMIIKFGKEQIPYQVITYICYGILDFYLIRLLTFLDITTEGIDIADGASVLISKPMITALVISIVVLAVTNIFNKSFAKRRLKELDNKLAKDYVEQPKEETPKKSTSIESKLAKLKALKDSGVLTEEEYQEKRKEIVKNLKL